MPPEILPADLPDPATPPEVARAYRVDPSTVRSWIESGELRAVNLASRSARRPRYRISRQALAEFLQSREPQPKPPTRPRRTRPKTEAVDYVAMMDLGGTS